MANNGLSTPHQLYRRPDSFMKKKRNQLSFYVYY